MAILDLLDIFKYSRALLIPREPVSIYRYMEHLVELTIFRKYRPKKLLEIGPGIYPFFKYLGNDATYDATLIDYNDKVLAYCPKALPGIELETLMVDIEQPGALAKLGRRWDYVISNGVLEHIRNDVLHIKDLHAALEPGGLLACVTVLHDSLFNDWDRAVGHYRRYSVRQLEELFRNFSEVQILQTALIQELVRPLFFSRIRHLLKNTPEENNRLFGDEVRTFSKPPYSAFFGLVKYILPAYLVLDWTKNRWFGAIAIIIARK